MDSATQIFYKVRIFRLLTNVQGHVEYITQKQETDYAHARKSLPVTSPKELVLFLGKLNNY